MPGLISLIDFLQENCNPGGMEYFLVGFRVQAKKFSVNSHVRRLTKNEFTCPYNHIFSIFIFWIFLSVSYNVLLYEIAGTPDKKDRVLYEKKEKSAKISFIHPPPQYRTEYRSYE